MGILRMIEVLKSARFPLSWLVLQDIGEELLPVRG